MVFPPARHYLFYVILSVMQNNSFPLDSGRFNKHPSVGNPQLERSIVCWSCSQFGSVAGCRTFYPLTILPAFIDSEKMRWGIVPVLSKGVMQHWAALQPPYILHPTPYFHPPSQSQPSLSSGDYFRPQKPKHKPRASDQCCFLTGFPGPQNEAAHILNSIDNTTLKQQVEDYLTQQHFQNPGFSRFYIDGPENLFYLDSNIHKNFDMLGSIGFLPPLKTLMMIAPALCKDNMIWRMEFVRNSGETFPLRPLDSFHTIVQPSHPPTMEAFVFHPTILCPQGRPIDIAEDRRLYYPEEKPDPTYTPNWCAYTASGDELIKVLHPRDPLGHFTPPNIRSSYGYPQISHFAVLVALHSKFRHFTSRYGLQALSPRGQDCFHFLNEIAHQIWYTPDQNIVHMSPYVLKSVQE